MFWRLHKAIFGEQLNTAIKIIEEMNDSYQIVEGTPSQLLAVPFEKLDEPSLAITTLQDANRLAMKNFPSTPWLFFNKKTYEVSFWLPRIENNISVLNRNAIFVPKGNLKNIQQKQLNCISDKNAKIFIKPNSGNKVFPGFSINNDELFLENVEKQLKFSYVEPEEMCVLSEHKDIENIEWRFWIAEREIIAYTPYSWDLDPELIEPPTNIIRMAQLMTQNDWQPDYVYVADFCTTLTGEVMLIEINAASTSGVYNAKLEKLLPKIRNTCIREYNGEIDF
jgi:hypothetical protein